MDHVIVFEGQVHTEVAPNGIPVFSNVPFIEPRWWDNPVLHFVWSYCSWGTMILQSFGFQKPRDWFESWGKRPL